MLRSLGFVTGAALTATLAMSMAGSLSVDGLRRSVQQLFETDDRNRETPVRTIASVPQSPPDSGTGTGDPPPLQPAPNASASDTAAADILPTDPGLVPADTPDPATAIDIASPPAVSADDADVSKTGTGPAEGAGETEVLAHAPTVAQALSGPPAPAERDGAWHVYWTPFHSQASAEGFARHLTRSSGVDHQVVKIGPGQYRVAFWHRGDAERSRRLIAIEQASGLRLSGGEL